MAILPRLVIDVLGDTSLSDLQHQTFRTIKRFLSTPNRVAGLWFNPEYSAYHVSIVICCLVGTRFVDLYRLRFPSHRWSPDLR